MMKGGKKVGAHIHLCINGKKKMLLCIKIGKLDIALHGKDRHLSEGALFGVQSISILFPNQFIISSIYALHIMRLQTRKSDILGEDGSA